MIEYYSPTKEEIVPFATTWMDLGIVLSAVGRQKKTKYLRSSYVKS